MRKSLTTLRLFLCIFLLFLLQAKSLFSQCNNADFENGSLNGWSGTWGDGVCDGIFILGICAGISHPDPFQYAGIHPGMNNQAPTDLPERNHFIMSSGYDPVIGATTLPVVYTPGSYSMRLGNAQADGGGESISYSFTVSPGNANFTYHYAVVLNDGGHPAGEQPYFKIRMWDGSNNLIDCATYDVDALTAYTIGGFTTLYGDVLYKPWTSVFIPLSDYMGQRVKIQFSTRDCSPDGGQGAHYAYAYIDAQCGPLEILSSSPSVCGTQHVTLTAPAGAATYQWTGPGVVPPGNTQEATITLPGHYTVEMTTFATVPCTFSLDTVITGSPVLPVANFSAPSICAGNPTAFSDLSTPDSISSWEWDFNNDGTPDVTAQNPAYTFPEAGTYPVKLVVSVSSCIDDTTINVVVFAAPNSTFITTSPVCVGMNSTITYTGNAPANASYTWDFAGGTIISGSGQGPYEVNWLTAGTKNITLTAGTDSCAFIAATEVIPNPTAIFSAGGNTLRFTGTPINFHNHSQNAVSYFWTFGNTQTSAEENPTVTFADSGTYTITLHAFNRLGCPDSTELLITVIKPESFYIPNAFTPDGDGINDVFRVFGKGFPSFHFLIFDRWGTKLFEATDQNAGWDGTFRGKPSPPGVYVYYVDVEFFSGLAPVEYYKHQKGSVTLIR